MMDPTDAVVIKTDHDSAFFWEAAGRHRLVAQRCVACQRLWHPPGPICPHCQHLEWEVEDLPLAGTLYSAAKVHEPGSPIQGTHYLIALVEVADPRHNGDVIRIAGNLRDAQLEEALVGARVRIHFESLSGDHALPQFSLAGPGEAA